MKKLWNKELPVWLNCLHLFCRAFQIAVIGYFAYNLYLTISTGQNLSNPMLYFFAFIIPGQVYNRFATRNKPNYRMNHGFQKYSDCLRRRFRIYTEY